MASFFGSPAMNLIAGEARRTPGGRAFAFGGRDIPLDGMGPIPDGPITLGVRPESVRLDGVAGGHRARVTLVEPLGKEALVYLDHGSERLLIAVADPAFRTEEGASV